MYLSLKKVMKTRAKLKFEMEIQTIKFSLLFEIFNTHFLALPALNGLRMGYLCLPADWQKF